MARRVAFPNGYTEAMKNILWLEEHGFTRDQIVSQVGISKTRIIAAVRIYKASLGLTPDSARIEIREKAIELVKLLEADEISLTKAEEAFVAEIDRLGIKRIPVGNSSSSSPERQLETYRRAVGALEGICLGLAKMPEFVHSGITLEERQEIESRLASCRKTIEQRINIFRKDSNGVQAPHS